MSSSPLNPHPQDAVAGDNAKSGVGTLQRTARVQPGEHHLIEHGYVPVRQLTGKVVGVWGDARIRLLDGEVKPLHVGDVVKKGEVVLTSQDGIVQFEASHTLLASAGDDVERIIPQVGRGDSDVVPAAGPNSGGGAGSLEEGLRVERDAESVTPGSLEIAPPVGPTSTGHAQAVSPLETPLVANPDTETTAANAPVVFDPRSNDRSLSAVSIVAIAGHPISAGSPVTLPQGVVSMNADGTFTFTPNHNFNGSVSFTYTDQNGVGETATSTVTVNVGNLNDHQPVAVADMFSGIEDTPITGAQATNDTPSADGGNVWSVATGPAHGTVTVNADGTFSYVPAAHYSGPDSFTYTITDVDGSTSTTTVALNVAPVPLAVADTFTVAENAPISGSLATNDTASPNGSGTWSLTTGAAHGSVTVHADGTYTYTPAAGYHGTDTFTYTITDAAGSSSTATVTLTVAPATPVAAPDTIPVHESTPVTGSLAGNDTPVPGETNTWTVTGEPTHGAVTVNPDGTYTYTPTPGFTGTDTFIYAVADGSGQASTATVTLTVSPIAPVAVADTVTVTENAPVSGTLAGNDTPVAGETNTWIVAANPSHGNVTVNPDGTFTYTPTTGYNGLDSFTYTITDGSGQTSTAAVTLAVAPAAPTAAPDTFTVNENAPSGTLNVLGNDAPMVGEHNNWAVASNPAHGTLTPAADFATTGNFTYTPNTGYTGADSFTYTITDDSGKTSTATVTLAVEPITPTATADGFAVAENATSPTLNVSGNDAPVAGETNAWSIASNPAHGTLTPAGDFATSGNFTYTPNAGYIGTDTFTYTITDDSGKTSTATVTLTVAAINPGAANDVFPASENASTGTLSVKTNDSPVAGESNIWSVASNATAHGTITPTADFATTGNFTYTPNTGFSGADTFTYALTDGSSHTSTATVTINVAPVNPGAADDTFAATENASTGTLNLAANDAPVAGETNTWSVASNATAHGTITPAADFATTGNFTYTPNAGFSGADTFTYTLTDGSGHSSTATVTINVAPINPTAVNDAFTVTANGPSSTLSVQANDTPVAGETNTWSVKSNPAHGTITPAADFATSGNFTYTPTTGFTGVDTFTYLITDTSGHTSTATVTLNVTAEVAPVATADTYAATENTLLVFNGVAGSANHTLTANDSDADGDPLTVTQINGVAFDATHPATIVAGGVTEGTVSMNSAGVIAFNPATNYTGNVDFSYTISDGHGGTSTTTVAIAVAAGTDDPTVSVTDVGRWLFNEASGTTTTDAYNNVTGTLTDLNTANGGTTPIWVTGHNGTAGTALSFDGKGGGVSVPLANTAVLDTTSSLSVWFKTTQVGTTIGWSSPSIIGSEHQRDGNDIQWGSINNKGQIGLGLGNDPTGVYSAAAVNDGNWHDLTITRTVNSDGSSAVSVYIDGALGNSATLAAQPAATTGIPFNELAGFGYTNAWSGTGAAPVDDTSGDVYYKGTLDDAAIYSHALTADQAKAIYLVQNGYENEAVANDGDPIKLTVTDTQATALHVIGVESGMILTDGTHTVTSTGNSEVIDVTGWNLSSMQLTNVGTGSATLEFDAINVNANGQTEDTSTYLSVVNGTSLLSGTTGNDTLDASANTTATFISGNGGNEVITGGSGNDRLIGGTGNDTISGGTGNDIIDGGGGTDTLTGGAGNDVFQWQLGEHGTAGTPGVVTITDFSSVAGNMDVINLRDLLSGENHNGTDPGNIASFLHFDHSGADTIIHVSTTGGFVSGYSASLEDATIALKGVDLTSSGTQNDSQIVHQLLSSSQLHLG